MVVKTKMAYISLVSRVIVEILAKNSKNSKNTTRRVTSAIWRIFAARNNPKSALSKMK